MTPYKTNEANILYSVRQNSISNNNFQIADTCTHCNGVEFISYEENPNKSFPSRGVMFHRQNPLQIMVKL